MSKVLEYVIGFIVVFLAWSYLNARARLYYSNQSMVEREINEGVEAPYPSWISNKDRMEEFAFMLNTAAKRRSIPEKFVAFVMTTEYTQNKLLFTAGLMEKKGASFEEQALAVVNYVEKYWLNVENKHKRSFIGGESF